LSLEQKQDPSQQARQKWQKTCAKLAATNKAIRFKKRERKKKVLISISLMSNAFDEFLVSTLSSIGFVSQYSLDSTLVSPSLLLLLLSHSQPRVKSVTTSLVLS